MGQKQTDTSSTYLPIQFYCQKSLKFMMVMVILYLIYKVIDVREDILQFWYGVSDTEYLLLSWPSQIIVRWFSKDILAKHPLTEVVRSLGLQNINFTLYHICRFNSIDKRVSNALLVRQQRPLQRRWKVRGNQCKVIINIRNHQK